MPAHRSFTGSPDASTSPPIPSNELRALRRELAALRNVLADVVARTHSAEANDPLAHLPAFPSTLPAFTPFSGRVYRRWPLQQLRHSRGWSQPALIARMRTVAAAQGVHLPENSSLKTMVSRWENGGQRVGGFYDAILCAVFDLTEPDTDATHAPVVLA